VSPACRLRDGHVHATRRPSGDDHLAADGVPVFRLKAKSLQTKTQSESHDSKMRARNPEHVPLLIVNSLSVPTVAKCRAYIHAKQVCRSGRVQGIHAQQHGQQMARESVDIGFVAGDLEARGRRRGLQRFIIPSP
jgi:hypothetical protein